MGTAKKQLWVAFVGGFVAFSVTALVVLPILPATLSRYPFASGYTSFRLQSLAELVKKYKVEQGKFPKTLSEVAQSKYEMQDSWGHPLIYEIRENRVIIGTLGRDGKPGGVGWDADYTNQSKHVPKPTLKQIFSAQKNKNIDDYVMSNITICILNGILWFFALAYSASKEEENAPKRSKTWHVLNYGGILALFAVTVFGVVVMAALDIPSGH